MFTAQFCFHSASECSLIIKPKGQSRSAGSGLYAWAGYSNRNCAAGFTICSSLQLLKMRTMRNPDKKLFSLNGKFNLFDAFSFKSFYCKRIIVKVYYFIFLWKPFCYFQNKSGDGFGFAFMFLKNFRIFQTDYFIKIL